MIVSRDRYYEAKSSLKMKPAFLSSEIIALPWGAPHQVMSVFKELDVI